VSLLLKAVITETKVVKVVKGAVEADEPEEAEVSVIETVKVMESVESPDKDSAAEIVCRHACARLDLVSLATVGQCYARRRE